MEWSKSKTDANYALTSFFFFVYCAYSNSRNKTHNSNIVKHNLSPRQRRQFDPLSRMGQKRDYLTHLRSELGSGLNMKVVALDLSFPTHFPCLNPIFVTHVMSCGLKGCKLLFIHKLSAKIK